MGSAVISLEKRVLTGYGSTLGQVLFFHAMRTFSALKFQSHGLRLHLSEVSPARFCLGIPRHLSSVDTLVEPFNGAWNVAARFIKTGAPRLNVVGPYQVLVDVPIPWLPTACLVRYRAYIHAKRVDRCITITAHTPTVTDATLLEYLVTKFDRDRSQALEVVHQSTQR